MNMNFSCSYTSIFFISIVPLKIFRLQGPLSASGTGRLEVFYSGQWGTVCRNNWDMNDATVACRQLGYKKAVHVPQGNDVPPGTGKIWLNAVNCNGSEQSLLNCSHSGWGVTYGCYHFQDAGVECSSTGKIAKLLFIFLHGNITRELFPRKLRFENTDVDRK